MDFREPVIVFENISKNYNLYHQFIGIKNFIFHLPQVWKESKKKFYALQDVSFSIYKGEIVGFLGANGAGKSTVLSLIAQVLFPDKGKIEVKGKISPLLELGAGFHPELTGRENIYLNAILLGMTRSEVNQKMDSIIAFSELHQFIDQPIRTYSSGMIARLGFSVAIHIEPDILLIDEILAVGDAHFHKKSFSKVMELKQKGITIILVSHNLPSITEICNKVIWLEKGKIVKIGENVKEIVKQYQEKSI